MGFGVGRFKKLATARSEAMTDPKSCGHFERIANGERQTPIAERQTGKYVFLLLLTAFFWSLGGVLIKSIDWNPVAIAGSRSFMAPEMIKRNGYNQKVCIWMGCIQRS